ncbi:MAG TPA: aspartyl protease family protein [Candidatus Acidoferrum sp.]|nr:aspartyl protease family protein [Candidatus Acidoferrum sp.]
MLAEHLDALKALQVREPQTHETTGTLLGAGISGAFHEWVEGDKARRDDTFGIRTQRTLRVGDRLWQENANGEIRELQGIIARRQVTEDFIDSGEFAKHPEDVQFVDHETLYDGRDVYVLLVSAPNGEPYRVALDTKTWLVDQEGFVDGDSMQTATYSDYKVVDGLLIPYTEVDSDGTHAFDITSHVTTVTVDQPIAASIFALLPASTVSNTTPVIVPYEEHGGLMFAKVTIDGKPHTFLIDSAAQADVFDVSLAATLGLHPEGTVEIRGTGRTTSPGVIEAPPITLGGVTFPMHVATVLKLPQFEQTSVDGILGYPFFAAAELRFDPTQQNITIGQPGSLPIDGTKIAVDTDRELPEIIAQVQGAPTRVIVDTGNQKELLVFKSFIEAHPGLVSLALLGPTLNRGIGGSVDTVGTIVYVLQLGPYRLFNRYADVVLSTTGAFADRNDGGNVGYGSLRNFVMTFDLAEHALYLQKAQGFDDGHDRRVPQL